jgi:hypothetical protein
MNSAKRGAFSTKRIQHSVADTLDESSSQTEKSKNGRFVAPYPLNPKTMMTDVVAVVV